MKGHRKIDEDQNMKLADFILKIDGVHVARDIAGVQ